MINGLVKEQHRVRRNFAAWGVGFAAAILLALVAINSLAPFDRPLQIGTDEQRTGAIAPSQTSPSTALESGYGTIGR